MGLRNSFRRTSPGGTSSVVDDDFDRLGTDFAQDGCLADYADRRDKLQHLGWRACGKQRGRCLQSADAMQGFCPCMGSPLPVVGRCHATNHWQQKA